MCPRSSMRSLRPPKIEVRRRIRRSRPYAEDAGVNAGLYYLGESCAVMDFAAVRTNRLMAGVLDAARAFRSIALELGARSIGR